MDVGAKRRNIRGICRAGYGGRCDIECGFVDNILDDGSEDWEQYDEEQGNAKAGPYDGGDDEPATFVEWWLGRSRGGRGGLFRLGGGRGGYGSTSGSCGDQGIVCRMGKGIGIIGSTGRRSSISWGV